MARSSPCKEGAIPLFCGAACCYIPKKYVTTDEVEEIGLECVTKEGDDYYLRNNPITGTCIFLDAASSQCRIYDKRPETCRIYNCRKDTRIDSIVAMIDSRTENDRLARRIIVAELQATAEAAYPNIGRGEALELLCPGIYLTG